MRGLGIVVGCLLLSVGYTASVAADPPRPGTTDSGLNESEEATLWTNQPSETYVSTDAYREAYGENRTTIHQVGNGTDLTFTEPPGYAARWTEYSHTTYEPGGTDTSVYPSNASTTNSTVIQNAHATIFGVHPATHAYVEENDTRFYVAPAGELRGTVDYRVAPTARPTGVPMPDLSVRAAEISEARLYADDELVASQDGSHDPSFEYEIDDDVETLRFEADIDVTVRYGSDGGIVTDSVTVEDSVSVDVYDLQATAHYTSYPDGTTGVSIYQSDPWQGYSLSADGRQSVRGIWRFFNARDTAWDELERASSDEYETVDSEVLPVYVHAFPSAAGPRAKPEHAGPTIVETWGETRAPPTDQLPENVSVSVVNESYEPTYGMAVEARNVESDELTVHGIVHETEADILESPTSPREVHESSLTSTIRSENESGATVLLELTDAETGSPIILEDDRSAPITPLEQDGYIEIDGERVTTNASGEVEVFLSQPGSYTATYEPESWLSAYPPYAGDTTVVRWHPLSTISGWLDLFVRFGMVLLLFGAALYAGYRFGSLLQWRQR